jgi:hypothetical protein
LFAAELRGIALWPGGVAEAMVHHQSAETVGDGGQRTPGADPQVQLAHQAVRAVAQRGGLGFIVDAYNATFSRG